MHFPMLVGESPHACHNAPVVAAMRIFNILSGLAVLFTTLACPAVSASGSTAKMDSF
jgi:hypothetical protein